MPISQYYGGHGDEVMTNMQKEYGTKKGTRVFYATANKRKGFAGPPKGRGFTTPPSMALRRQMRASAVCTTCGGLHAEHRLNVPVSL